MSDRKFDHIRLAFKSQTESIQQDKRFTYEPLLKAHPQKELSPFSFLEKEMRTPIWVSSMTGGTGLAKKINQNIAKACKEFGMGMGLGSCRILLENNDFLDDFKVRKIIGDQLPMYANLGIAQIEILFQQGKFHLVSEMLKRLEADGLIIHVNPLQEWFQPEGNKIHSAPIDTIKRVLDSCDFPIIVKEVGQGMGIKSIQALLELPIAALDFGAYGGTNFSLVELYRNNPDIQEIYKPFAFIGQNAEEMIEDINRLVSSKKILCKEVIISGGVKNFLDGYYLMGKSKLNSVYGQAAPILKHAKESYESLHQYLETQVKGLQLANNYLSIRE